MKVLHYYPLLTPPLKISSTLSGHVPVINGKCICIEHIQPPANKMIVDLQATNLIPLFYKYTR